MKRVRSYLTFEMWLFRALIMVAVVLSAVTMAKEVELNVFDKMVIVGWGMAIGYGMVKESQARTALRTMPREENEDEDHG